MNKLPFYFIVFFILSIVSGCDKSLNDHEIYAVFFDKISNVDELNKLHDYSYNFSNKVVYYYEDFNNPNSTNWGIGNSKYSNRTVSNGYYIIKSYVDHTSLLKLIYDQTKDFQIEMTITDISWRAGQSKHFAGLVFDITEESGGTSLIVRRINSENQVIVFDITNNKELFQTSNLVVKTPITFTIRKINGHVSYFINKKFLYKTIYNHVETNIGYIISKGSTIVIDSVQIDYLE